MTCANCESWNDGMFAHGVSVVVDSWSMSNRSLPNGRTWSQLPSHTNGDRWWWWWLVIECFDSKRHNTIYSLCKLLSCYCLVWVTDYSCLSWQTVVCGMRWIVFFLHHWGGQNRCRDTGKMARSLNREPSIRLEFHQKWLNWLEIKDCVVMYYIKSN